MLDKRRSKMQMQAADLSAKICAIRQSVMNALKDIPSVQDQKAMFGISLLLAKVERDAAKLANNLDDIHN